MRAIVVERPGGPEVLTFGIVPDPSPGPNDVVVRVHATALNRLDLLQREGRYPVPPGAPDILGVEMAGEVARLGDLVRDLAVGDRVCALLPGGGYAEYVSIPAAMAIPIPDRLSFEEAAGIPEVFLTSYLNLFDLGGLQSGGCVLLHAGASGVGTAAIQLAREAGAEVLVTAGTAAKLAACRRLGATFTWNYHDGPFEPAVIEHVGARGVDVILDMVGAPYWSQNLACLAVEGRLILVSMLGGSTLQLDLAALQRKRIRVIGTTLRPLPLERKIALTLDFARFALPRFAAGSLSPVIDRVFDWANAGEAHRYMALNQNIGKIVLRVGAASAG